MFITTHFRFKSNAQNVEVVMPELSEKKSSIKGNDKSSVQLDI